MLVVTCGRGRGAEFLTGRAVWETLRSNMRTGSRSSEVAFNCRRPRLQRNQNLQI